MGGMQGQDRTGIQSKQTNTIANLGSNELVLYEILSHFIFTLGEILDRAKVIDYPPN